MLSKENLRQTIRLILLGAFAQTEAQLTYLIQELYNDCPTLFEALIPRSEQENLSMAGVTIDDDEQVSITGDDAHRRPVAIGRLEPKYCRDTLGLPTRASDLPANFRSALRRPYDDDYKMPNVLQFGKRPIFWCKKMAFQDP